MRCPFCGSRDTQVKDTRPAADGTSIRRRRSCGRCMARFTTFERVQLREMMVVKRNHAREPLDREKVERSLQTALRKRPVNAEDIERITNSIIRRLESGGSWEITTKVIGEMVMDALKEKDTVAYVRYASVYRDFNEGRDFEEFISDEISLQSQLPSQKNKPVEQTPHPKDSISSNAPQPPLSHQTKK